jgi:hypothetical protein
MVSYVFINDKVIEMPKNGLSVLRIEKAEKDKETKKNEPTNE